MTVIRPNSITGINSITAQSSTVEFYDPSGNTITVQANVTGNITGNVVGNVTGNLTGTATTATTAVTATTATTAITATNALGISTTQITVGNSFLKNEAVGLGTTTTAGRLAGVSTAPGTIVYNAETGTVEVYKQNAGWTAISATGDSPPPPPNGITATGGIINDYQDGATLYRTHTFTSSGTFDVTDVDSSTLGTDVDYLVVAGGGGGGQGGDATLTSYQAGGGGGGAGGLLTSDPTAPAPTRQPATPVSVQSYTVTIGAGGLGGEVHTSYGKHGRRK